MSNYDTMGKSELRAACKAAGIKYTNMTNQTMREALHLHDVAREQERAAAQAEVAPVVTTPAPSAEWKFHTPPTAVTPAADPTPAEAAAPAAVEKPAKLARPARPQQNGVKMPGEGGVCRRVWDWMDEHKEATAADVRTWATGAGLNPNNAQIERSQWRKFHGLNKTAKPAT